MPDLSSLERLLGSDTTTAMRRIQAAKYADEHNQRPNNAPPVANDEATTTVPPISLTSNAADVIAKIRAAKTAQATQTAPPAQSAEPDYGPPMLPPMPTDPPSLLDPSEEQEFQRWLTTKQQAAQPTAASGLASGGALVSKPKPKPRKLSDDEAATELDKMAAKNSASRDGQMKNDPTVSSKKLGLEDDDAV